MNTKNRINNLFRKYDMKICYALLSSFVILMIQYFFLITFNLLDSPGGSIVRLSSKIIVGIIYISAFSIVIKGNTLRFMFIYVFSLIIFLINFLVFPENSEYIWQISITFFPMCLPSFLYSLQVSNFTILKDIMKKASFIILLVGVLISFLVLLQATSIGPYSMTLSYYLLMPCVVYLDELFEHPTLKSALYFSLSLIIILAIGSRGALLCIIIFVILKAVESLSNLSKWRALIYFFILFGGIFILIFFKQILSVIYDALLAFGIDSRTIKLLIDGEIINLSGRDMIITNIVNEISQNPFLGIGIGGDRRVNGDTGLYSHNIFIEIVSNFGIVVGVALIILLILIIIRSLATANKLEYSILIIWISIGFIPFLVSGSYLEDIKFWILLGLLFNKLIRNQRKNKRSNYYN